MIYLTFTIYGIYIALEFWDIFLPSRDLNDLFIILKYIEFFRPELYDTRRFVKDSVTETGILLSREWHYTAEYDTEWEIPHFLKYSERSVMGVTERIFLWDRYYSWKGEKIA